MVCFEALCMIVEVCSVGTNKSVSDTLVVVIVFSDTGAADADADGLIVLL